LSKTFKAPDDHIAIRTTFKIYLIDSWDNEKFIVDVDG